MTTKFSDGSAQVLAAVGPSLPVMISQDSQQSALPPTVAVASSPDGNYFGRVEVTLDQPDANGNLPTPGAWLPFDDFGVGGAYITGATGAANLGQINHYAPIKIVVTAVRANLTSWTAGSCTFEVRQPAPRQRSVF